MNKLLLGVVMTRPATFFDWLYRRDWYGEMMRDWAFGQGIAPVATVLELGCGSGNLSADMAAHGWQVTGADRSEKMLTRARSGVGGAARFVEADALDLPFDAGAFEAVLSASLVNLVPDRPAMLAEVARVLKPGGIVTMLFPNPGFDTARARDLAADRGIRGFSGAALRLWAGSAPKLDPETLIAELGDAGFIAVQQAMTLDGNIAIVTAR
jgi:ubiquinone/menaquinone biosynthesis C-methylase UbiE